MVETRQVNIYMYSYCTPEERASTGKYAGKNGIPEWLDTFLKLLVYVANLSVPESISNKTQNRVCSKDEGAGERWWMV